MNGQPGEARTEIGVERALNREGPVLITEKTQALWGAVTDGEVSRADLVLLWTDIGFPILKALPQMTVTVSKPDGDRTRAVVGIKNRAMGLSRLRRA